DRRGADQRPRDQIARFGGRGAHADLLLVQEHRQRVAIGFRVGDDRGNAQLTAGALDAQRDLTAVRDQDLPKHHAITSPPSTLRTWPVTYAAASDTRKAAASATSAGAPSRPSGIVSRSLPMAASGTAAHMSVAM